MAGLPQPGFMDFQEPDEATLIRRIEAIERAQRELGPAVMGAIGPQVAALTAQQAALAAAVADLNAVINAQIDFGSIGYSATAFTIPTSMSNVVSQTITIPAGYTRAAILGVATIGAWNGSAGGGYIYASTVVNGSPGAIMPIYVGASSYGEVTASAIRTLTGLTPGGTITVQVGCYATGAWGSNASNIANLDAIAIFRR